MDVGIFDEAGRLSSSALTGESRRLLEHATALL